MMGNPIGLLQLMGIAIPYLQGMGNRPYPLAHGAKRTTPSVSQIAAQQIISMNRIGGLVSFFQNFDLALISGIGLKRILSDGSGVLPLNEPNPKKKKQKKRIFYHLTCL